MPQLYFVPRWFFGYDIALEILFGIITLFVALYSFKMYRLSAQRESRILGIGFLCMSLGYFSWSFFNLYLSSYLSHSIGPISLTSLSLAGSVAVYAYVAFFVVGCATLAYMTLPVRSDRVYVTLLTLSLLIIVFANQKALAFYFVSSYFLLLVLFHFFKTYYQYRHSGAFLMFVAFTFIFLGNVDFIFATLHEVHYFVGHVLHFIGYTITIITLLLLLRS